VPLPDTASDGALRAEIAPLVQRIWEAYRAGDIAAHNALLTDDYSAIHPDGSVHPRPTREQILAQPLRSFSLTELTAAPIGDGAALVQYLADVQGPPNNPVRVRFRVGELWLKRGQQWKCRSYQPTVMSAP
jgi:ketosteroid isomerase-like protein